MTVSRMFPFITCTWNPLGGKCHYECAYDWAQGPKGLVKRHHMAKYTGGPIIIEKELKRRFKPDDFVFVCDMCDLFGDWVRSDLISDVLYTIRGFPETRFLFLTKNPHRYYALGYVFPRNCVFGCTIESNRNYPELSRAPPQHERLNFMQLLRDDIGGFERFDRFISIEPILDFDLNEFLIRLRHLKPWAVAVGYDNYDNKLVEPSLEKTLELINRLENAGIKVYRKTLRKAWNEK